jgi:RES domain-containing protein
VSEARDRSHLHLVSPTETWTGPVEPISTVLPVVGMSDRDLARKLARVELVSMDAAIWRHMSPSEHSKPDSGDGAIRAGGRFNPPGSFPVIYGCMSRAAAGAEFRRLALRHPIGIDNLLPRHLYRFRLKSEMVLDLRLSCVRKTLGLPNADLASIHRSHSQIIGEIARALRIGVILAPSVTGAGAMVAVFPELIPRFAWEFRHMEIWVRMMDVPEAPELEYLRAWDDRMTM